MKNSMLGVLISLCLFSFSLYAQEDQLSTQEETTTTTTPADTPSTPSTTTTTTTTPADTPSTPSTTTTIKTTQTLAVCNGNVIQNCEDLVQASCSNYYVIVNGGDNHQCTWDESQTPAKCVSDMTSECAHQ